MADLFTGILGGIGALGSLFGGNAAQNEANRLKQRQLGLQERALGNYEKYAGIAQGYRDQGSPYLKKQGGVYDTLGQYGTTDRNNAMNLLSQLLPQYASTSGVQGVNFPGSAPQGQQPTTGPLSVSKELYNRPYDSRLMQGPTKADAGGNAPSSAGQYQTGLTESQYVAAESQAKEAQNPYGLSQPQQEMLNSRIDAINTQAESAIQEYRAALAQSGMPPNPAGEARIREQLGSLVNSERNQAAVNAQQERQKALSNLINLALGEKAQGTDLIGQQAQGYGNVASGYNSYAGSALGQADSGPFAALSGVMGQQSQFNTQRADSQYEALGQLLPFLQELFKKSPKKPAAEPYSMT